MGFDVRKFEEAKFTRRTAEIDVPELQQFFGEDEKPVWKVQGLTAPEVARANEAAKLNKDVGTLVEAMIANAATEDKIDAIRESFGLTDNVPDEIARRLSLLVQGSIDPKIKQSVAVRLANTFPTAFFSITTKIIELTGQGQSLGE